MRYRGGPLTGPDRAAADRVAALLPGSGRLGVAFSGGVDSSVLLALAARALGPDRVRGRLGRFAEPRRGRAGGGPRGAAATSASRWSRSTTREGDRDAYRANGPDRCFHCKDELFTPDRRRGGGRPRARRGGVRRERRRRAPAGPARAPGPRPRTRAATARRRGPGQGRRCGGSPARWALPCADKPAAPCLASRIPHFTEVVAGEAAPGRAGRGGAAPAGLRRPAGAPPRRPRPLRAAGRRLVRGPSSRPAAGGDP